MNSTLRRRLWIEIMLGGVAASLGVVTVMWRDWIEVIFRVDPDRGSGALEWLIVFCLFAGAFILELIAMVEWRHYRIDSRVTGAP